MSVLPFFRKVAETTAVHLVASGASRMIENALDNSQQVIDTLKKNIKELTKLAKSDNSEDVPSDIPTMDNQKRI